MFVTRNVFPCILVFSILTPIFGLQFSAGSLFIKISFGILVLYLSVLYISLREMQPRRDSIVIENDRSRPFSKDPFALSIAVACVFGFSLSGFFAYLYINAKHMETAEVSWLAVDATIVSNGILNASSKNGGGRWIPVWTYTYSVEGHFYTDQNYAERGNTVVQVYNSKDLAEHIKNSRMVGNHVEAYYDPKNPGRAVLERLIPGSDDSSSLKMALFFIIQLIFVVGYFLVEKNKNKI